jgi:hypothetical protein
VGATRSCDSCGTIGSADDSTPLWFYVLREGHVLGDGRRHLGPVGARIVGEVFLGLLSLDRDEFEMIDFLTFAGVAPDQRGQ